MSQNEAAIVERVEFGFWITDLDGSNGRWMSDEGDSKKCWVGSEDEAHCYAAERQRIYGHLRYSVREVQ